MDHFSPRLGSGLQSPRSSRVSSKRFLEPGPSADRGCQGGDRGRLGPERDQFAEGPWLVIRVQLEREGWNPSQIEMLHGQLRQGWSLAMAKANVAQLSGHCPIKARTVR